MPTHCVHVSFVCILVPICYVGQHGRCIAQSVLECIVPMLGSTRVNSCSLVSGCLSIVQIVIDPYWPVIRYLSGVHRPDQPTNVQACSDYLATRANSARSTMRSIRREAKGGQRCLSSASTLKRTQLRSGMCFNSDWQPTTASTFHHVHTRSIVTQYFG